MHCANGFPSMPHTPMHDVPESEKSGFASSSRLAPGGLQAWLGTFVAPPTSARRARQAAKGQRQRSATSLQRVTPEIAHGSSNGSLSRESRFWPRWSNGVFPVSH
ncbi:hypothetical protein CNYM01_06460 [Colletotrichum nymphaeae SA-01]|uniref:Uncharacterized protein n=1 Tax=Colletotrichum nymphaeae SA-01 TaxID=1460502 RepID=A0A135STY1_9PEZI|nr:hypothetical protein CNYM01_06460 [Colletotrichum nymphaeae SA-01]